MSLSSRMYEKIITAFYIICSSCLAVTAAQAQMLHPNKPDSAKKCAICHLQWVNAFFSENRDGELLPFPKEKKVASPEMCLSCHDGSIADSRNSVFHGPGHRSGIVPSKNVIIPEEFPLDYDGKMQCATCHTPHALPSSNEAADEIELFIRGSNKNSDFCKMCHTNKLGGSKQGNHSIDVSADRRPSEILKGGGRFGTAIRNQVICETCHIAHGGKNNKFLVLTTEDTTRSILCITCHGKGPAMPRPAASDRYSHPVNIKPKTTRMPPQWAHGEKLVLGSRGELICRTCHSPHNAVDNKKLLAERNYKDSLCLQCHAEKREISGSKHDIKTFAPDEKNIKGQKAAHTGPCSPCHIVHDGAGEMMWARTQKIDGSAGEFCINCHGPGGPAEKIMPRDFSHPMDITFSAKRFFRSKMKIRCDTCHDIHNPLPFYDDLVKQGVKHGKYLRLSREGASGICIDCHPRHGSVVGTDHDLRITAPDFINVSGQLPQQGGVCSPCHVAHNASHQKYLWSAPLGPATLKWWNTSYAAENDIMTMMCTGCHIPGGVAEQHIPKYGLHPREDSQADQPITYFDLVKHEFPFYTDEGEISERGNIACSTCHNPHRWDHHRDGPGPGVNVEGNATTSFLRADLHIDLCARCHKQDGLIKFKYYHSKISREKEKD